MLSGFLKKLLFARQFEMDQGKIEILGKRQIMLPSDVLLALSSINEKQTYATIKDSIKDSMAYYAKRVGVNSQGMLKSIEDVFETFGLGKIQIMKLDNEKKKVIVRVNNHPLTEKCSKAKTCVLHRATLAGTFSFLFNKDVEGEATQCLCQGNGYCEFIIK